MARRKPIDTNVDARIPALLADVITILTGIVPTLIQPLLNDLEWERVTDWLKPVPSHDCDCHTTSGHRLLTISMECVGEINRGLSPSWGEKFSGQSMRFADRLEDTNLSPKDQAIVLWEWSLLVRECLAIWVARTLFLRRSAPSDSRRSLAAAESSVKEGRSKPAKCAWRGQHRSPPRTGSTFHAYTDDWPI